MVSPLSLKVFTCARRWRHFCAKNTRTLLSAEEEQDAFITFFIIIIIVIIIRRQARVHIV